MSISLSPLYVLQEQVRHIYTHNIRRRGWRMLDVPKSQRLHVEGVARVIHDNKANVEDWITAGFEKMPKEWCKRQYNVAFPPLFTFTTDGAHTRWVWYMADKLKSVPCNRTLSNRVRERIKSSLPTWEFCRTSKGAATLAYKNGTLSGYFVAAMVLNGDWPWKEPEGTHEMIQTLRSLPVEDLQSILQIVEDGSQT